MFAAAPAAQTLVRDHAGIWRAPRLKIDSALTAADRTAVAAWTTQITDVLKRAPSLGALKGYDAFPIVDASLGRPADGAGHAPVAGAVFVYLGPYKATAKGAVANQDDAVATIEVRVNDLSMVTGGTETDGYTVFGDDEGDFIKGPRDPDGDAHGLPMYEQGSDQWLIVRKPDTPLLVPVSRQRYLAQRVVLTDARLAKANASLATYGNQALLAGPMDELKKSVAEMNAYLAAVQHQLASMSAADRAASAYIESESATEAPVFTKSVDGATAILNLNPQLFDAHKPRASAQTLAIRIDARSDAWPDLHDTLDREIDWAAFASVIH